MKFSHLFHRLVDLTQKNFFFFLIEGNFLFSSQSNVLVNMK